MPLKVSEMIKLIEADGWYLVATQGKPQAVQASRQAGASDRGGQAEQGVATWHRAQHPRQAGITRRTQ